MNVIPHWLNSDTTILLIAPATKSITSKTSADTAFNNIFQTEAAITAFWKLKKYIKEDTSWLLQQFKVPVNKSNQNPTGQTLSKAKAIIFFAVMTVQNISHMSQDMDTS